MTREERRDRERERERDREKKGRSGDGMHFCMHAPQRECAGGVSTVMAESSYTAHLATYTDLLHTVQCYYVCDYGCVSGRRAQIRVLTKMYWHQLSKVDKQTKDDKRAQLSRALAGPPRT